MCLKKRVSTGLTEFQYSALLKASEVDSFLLSTTHESLNTDEGCATRGEDL
ncbi:hypothetical protein BN903_53 [Halorubrum sp. AJ67]|nr:hypothetical protein BN903_53 [Halorubrum sp. AJ67]